MTNNIPREVCRKINKHSAEAIAANLRLGHSLHEYGAEFAIINGLDNASRVFLNHARDVTKLGPTETISRYLDLVMTTILPKFIRDNIEPSNAGLDEEILFKLVDTLMAKAGYELNIVATGATEQELADKLQAHVEGRGQTRQ